MMLIMVYVVCGYIMVKAIEAGVSMDKGYYFTYGASSFLIGDLMALWELPFLLGWIFWGFANVIFVTLFAAYAWTTLDWRLQEAADSSIGLETALTWGHAIKSFIVLILVGFIIDLYGFT